MTEPISQRADTPLKTRRRNPLANRNFRLLWLGESVSLVGDQFYTVALSWFVLQMTGSLWALGTLLFISGIPRTVFTLVGGVMADRMSPRTILLFSNLVRLAITITLMVIVISQTARLWMLYLISFSFGLVSAFFQPAALAIIPALAKPDELPGSNALMLGATLVAQALGQGEAGVIVNTVGVSNCLRV